MQVSLPVGLLIVVACFCLPVIVVYLMSKFMDWQDERNREPVVEIINIYGEDGELESQITIVDGVDKMIVGKL